MKWNDFLNPRSMLTPGVAGSVVMVIANTLWIEFLIPQKWTALVLSFLLIIPILMKFSASFIENIIYFIFNGLIVFALAVNANFAGGKLQDISDKKAKRIAIEEQYSTIFKTSLASADSSTDNQPQVKPLDGIQLAANDNQGNSTTNQNNTNTQNEKKKSEENKKKSNNKENREFFQKWF